MTGLDQASAVPSLRRDPTRDEQSRQPAARGDRPQGLAAGDTGCGRDAGAPAACERVPDRQRGVLTRRDDHDERDAEECRKLGDHVPKSRRRRR